MGDRVDGRGPAPARRRVADVALLERQEARVARELGEVRDVAGDEVVDRQRPRGPRASSSPTTQRPMNPAAPVTRILTRAWRSAARRRRGRASRGPSADDLVVSSAGTASER